MNSHLHSAITALAAFISVSSLFAAVESTSETFVATATAIAGNNNSASRLTLFLPQMVRPLVAAGTITSVQNDFVTDANADWTDGQFNGSNGAFYAEFSSGLIASIAETDGTTHKLKLSANVQDSVSAGVAYKIRRHFTIADIFGPKNETGLLPGTSANDADNIFVYLATSPEPVAIFYSNVFGSEGWRKADSTPAKDLIVSPAQGVMVLRKTAETRTVYLHGQVKVGPTLATIQAGYNLVGTLKTLTDLKLAELNLFTGSTATGVAAASNPTFADNVMIANADGSTVTYFYSNYSGFDGWFDAAYGSASDLQVSAGSAFFVHRKAANGAFIWSVPSE